MLNSYHCVPQEETVNLSDAIALPVLLEAVTTAGGLAQALQPEAAARLQRACALAALAAQDDPGSELGLGRADSEAGRQDAEMPGADGSRSAHGAGSGPGVADQEALDPKPEEAATAVLVAATAWPDMSDRALLAWPAGPLAAGGHLAGLRSRAQLRHIDWDAVLR